MSKIFSKVSACLLVVVLLLQGIVLDAHATEASTHEVTSDEVIEIEFSDENSELKLVKDKVYLLSYPVDGDGWQVTKLQYYLDSEGWVTLKEGEENDFFAFEGFESMSERVCIKLRCKSDQVVGFKSYLDNTITGEKRECASTVKVIVSLPIIKEGDKDSNIIFVPIVIPPEPENPDNPDEGETVLIPIDTSGWVFDSLTITYDGTEHTIVVEGLPDYVTAVYQDNSRTNAGTSNARVSFVVPEGYEVPHDMEATLTVEKAPICVLTKDNLVKTDDGNLEFSIPELPEGITCTYKVNGSQTDGSYIISDIGMYLVDAEFELAEGVSDELLENYVLSPSSVIYNVTPYADVDSGKYNIKYGMTMEQKDTGSDTEVCISVGVLFENSTDCISGLQYYLTVGSDKLQYVSSKYADRIDFAAGDPTVMYYLVCDPLNSGPIAEHTFTADKDAVNIPVTLTVDKGFWLGPGVSSETGAAPVWLIVNPSGTQIDVVLPSTVPANVNELADDVSDTANNVSSFENTLLVEITDEALGEINTPEAEDTTVNEE